MEEQKMSEIMNIKIEIPGLQQLAQALMQLAAATKAGGEAPVMQQLMPQQVSSTTAPQQTQPQGQPAATMPQQVPVQQQPNQIPVQPQPTPQPMPLSGPVPTQPMSQQVPTQPAQPVQPVQPQMPAQPTQIPTTAVPMTHTTDELAVAASQLVNMGKQARLLEILHGFGVNSLMELPTEKYGAFAGCLKAEGVKF